MRVISLITSVILCIFLLSCRKEKNRICELYAGSVEYAIGTIDRWVSTPFKVVYYYSFEVNGNSYEGKEKAYGIGQKDGSLIGKRFIVVHALGNPDNSDLNTDFFIESESDFQEFKEKHTTNSPKPDFPKKCQ